MPIEQQQPEVSEYRHSRSQHRSEVTEEHHGHGGGRRHHSASSSTRYEVTSTAVRGGHGSGSLTRNGQHRDNYRRHERHPSLETFKPNNAAAAGRP